jgi:hypothetical protein
MLRRALPGVSFPSICFSRGISEALSYRPFPIEKQDIPRVSRVESPQG